MAKFEYVSVWRLSAGLDAVWRAIYEAEAWPQWWPGLKSVEDLGGGGPDGVGGLRRFTWQGVLPYRLRCDITITRVETGRLIEGAASGDVTGLGAWRFMDHGGLTEVRCEWRVSPRRWWMSLMLALARPLVNWNHETLMGWGGAGLAKRLGARLVAARSLRV